MQNMAMLKASECKPSTKITTSCGRFREQFCRAVVGERYQPLRTLSPVTASTETKLVQKLRQISEDISTHYVKFLRLKKLSDVSWPVRTDIHEDLRAATEIRGKNSPPSLLDSTCGCQTTEPLGSESENLPAASCSRIKDSLTALRSTGNVILLASA